MPPEAARGGAPSGGYVVRDGLSGRLRAANPFLHERGGQDDGKSEHQEREGERGKPLRETEVLSQDIHDLQGHPRADGVDAEHLPQRAAVNLVDELLHVPSNSFVKRRPLTTGVYSAPNAYHGQ